jgi:hypothetical protein
MLAYFHPYGPLGHVFKRVASDLENVGVIGLGIGTVACYRLPDQHWTFYEIDPLVVSIAQDQEYFHFLSDCAPSARIVIGDGRLSLAQEPDASFDLFMVDAFSSDAIPMHLLTREAMALYLSRLAPGGMLVFHISNRHLDLSSVLADLAADAGAYAYLQSDPGGRGAYHFPSTWVIVAREMRDLERVVLDQSGLPWERLVSDPDRRVWTDDYGNFLSATRFWTELNEK